MDIMEAIECTYVTVYFFLTLHVVVKILPLINKVFKFELVFLFKICSISKADGVYIISRGFLV